MSSHVAHYRAVVRRCRKRIPEWSAEKCRDQAAASHRVADIAAFMGDDEPTSSLMHDFARELEDAAKQKEATK